MSDFDTIRLKDDGRGVVTLTLSRPARHNALDSQMIRELREAAARIGADLAVRAVVIAGEGKSFCAGADLAWMKQQMEASRDERSIEARGLAECLFALNILPQPVVARVQGSAFGGGLGLLAVSDVAVGVHTARFGFTETRLGVVPATIAPYVMARIGEGRARRVFMSGRIFDADEARDLAILSRVVEPGELDRAVEDEIAPYLSAAPEAVAAAKALARSYGPRIDADVISRSVSDLADAWEREDAKEGIAAFFEHRCPRWANAAKKGA